MPPQDPTKTVYQSQGKLWLYAGVPALAIIAYLIYAAVTQELGGGDGRHSDTSTEPPTTGRPAESTESK